jgi:hypothetical protein
MTDTNLLSGMQQCVRCLEHKPQNDQNYRRVNEIRSGQPYIYNKRVCRTCEYLQRGADRRANRAATNAARKRARTYERTRNGNLKKGYGITLAQYDAMLQRQGGECGICGKRPEDNELHKSGRPCPLAVDHNHSNGKVRGLLCGGCNRGLGDFRESEAAMVAAIEYLRKHKDG